MSSDPLLDVRIKIDRAKKHLAELEAEIATFHQSEPYFITQELDAKAEYHVFKIKIRHIVPDHWGGIIGDVVHNLRSALDLLAVALVVHNGHASKTAINDTYFPIASNKSTFSTEKIRRASATAIRLIERLKPYRGGTDAFWQLHRLDVLDKHRLLIPVGAAYRAFVLRSQFDGPPGFEGPDTTYITIRPRDRQFPLEDGKVILRYSAQNAPPPEDGDLQFCFEVAFGEGQVFDGEPVSPTLNQIIDFVDRVAAIIARRIFKTNWR